MKISEDFLSLIVSYCNTKAFVKFFSLNKLFRKRIKTREWKRNWPNQELIRLVKLNAHPFLVNLVLQDENVDPTFANQEVLKIAVKSNNLGIVDILLKRKKSDPSTNNYELVKHCFEYYHVEMVRKLIQYPGIQILSHYSEWLWLYAIDFPEFLEILESRVEFVSALVDPTVTLSLLCNADKISETLLMYLLKTFQQHTFYTGHKFLMVMNENPKVFDVVMQRNDVSFIYSLVCFQAAIDSKNDELIRKLLEHEKVSIFGGMCVLSFLLENGCHDLAELLLTRRSFKPNTATIKKIVIKNDTKMLKMVMKYWKVDFSFLDHFCLRFASQNNLVELLELINTSQNIKIY